MRPHSLAAFAASALAVSPMTACSNSGQTPAPATTTAAPERGYPPPSLARSDRPKIGTFGFDVAGMDRHFAPGDSFYNYANGTWARTTPIPADRAGYGAFDMLDELSTERTRIILDDASKKPGSKIGDLYASFLDEQTSAAKGAAPLKPRLDSIRAIRTRSELAAAMGAAMRIGVAGPTGADVDQDAKDPEKYAVYFSQAGLGLPDRDYYLGKDPKLAEVRTKYAAHVERMLALVGEKDAASRAKAIIAFEHGLAEAHWPRVETRDVDKAYNKMAWSALPAIAPAFDWQAWAGGMKAHFDTVIVRQPSAMTKSAALFARTPIPVLRDYLIWGTISSAAPYLSPELVQEDFGFYGTVLNGTPENRPRWKRGVRLVKGALGEDVAQEYVAQYFPPAAKAEADRLVQNLIAAMDGRLQQLTWMAPETKARARAKLAAFKPKIGYPDKWRDYSALRIRRDDLLGNVVAAREFEFDRNVRKLGHAVDRGEWFMTPMEVNAYANPTMNEVVFPAAILQPPFFDPAADPAVNYGGIGAVIGHEISHHFDDQGRKFDPTGRLAEWWTPADVQRFDSLTGRLADQYDKYEPLPGMHVQGRLTLGENIADVAGLTVAYDAYHRSLGGKPAPEIEGFTADQRFYLGWAQVWRYNEREESRRQGLLTDPHSPPDLRVATVRNVGPWYAAFGVKAGEGLYLAPADRVRIW